MHPANSATINHIEISVGLAKCLEIDEEQKNCVI